MNVKQMMNLNSAGINAVNAKIIDTHNNVQYEGTMYNIPSSLYEKKVMYLKAWPEQLVCAIVPFVDSELHDFAV